MKTQSTEGFARSPKSERNSFPQEGTQPYPLSAMPNLPSKSLARRISP